MRVTASSALSISSGIDLLQIKLLLKLFDLLDDPLHLCVYQIKFLAVALILRIVFDRAAELLHRFLGLAAPHSSLHTPELYIGHSEFNSNLPSRVVKVISE